MKLHEYPDREMMMIRLANHLAGELNSAVMRHDVATFAVPGGTTPGPCFDALCAADLDWDRVTVLLTDERWVPETSVRSNARLVRERLLVGRAAAARFLPYWREGATPEAAVDEIGAEVRGKLPLTVVLLGLGSDMHTASLFPGDPALGAALASGAPPVMAMGQGEAERRVTLTAPVLDGAMSKHLLIVGAEKREALERAARLAPDEAPIRAVWRDLDVHWAE